MEKGVERDLRGVTCGSWEGHTARANGKLRHERGLREVQPKGAQNLVQKVTKKCQKTVFPLLGS